MPSFWQRLLGRAGLGEQVEDTSLGDRRRDERKAVRREARIQWRDPAIVLQTCQGLIRDVSEGGIRVECEHPFLPNQLVEVEDTTGGTARFVVRYCREAAEGPRYTIGLYGLQQERRREFREPVKGSATLRWLGEGSRPQSCTVKVCDVSASGMQIECPSRLATGVRVTLEGAGFSRQALARHCKQTGDGYRVGLEFLG